MSKGGAVLKRVVLGKPMSSGELEQTLLPKTEYAETLQATSIRAVSLGLDPEETEKLGKRLAQRTNPPPARVFEEPSRT